MLGRESEILLEQGNMTGRCVCVSVYTLCVCEREREWDEGECAIKRIIVFVCVFLSGGFISTREATFMHECLSVLAQKAFYFFY